MSTVAHDTVLEGIDPRTGESQGSYPTTTPAQLDALVAAAAAARDDTGWRAAPARARALAHLAQRLQDHGEAIVQCAMGETGLSQARVTGELERTWRQVLAFAQLTASGAHFGVTIDPADPDARPVPRPDVRRMMVPIGPVAVFAAGNFPLAFSVAGGDTASALAAGSPVVCKAHPGHPGTSELVAAQVSAALRDAGLPEGFFGLVTTPSVALATTLVRHPAIEAIAFTGSLAAGRAIFDAAAARPRPIPVFAEMGSLNPVVVTAAALAARGDAIATALAGAITRDGGQLCTKPGLVLAPAGDATATLADALAKALAQVPPAVMLDARLHANALTKIAQLRAHPAASPLAAADAPDNGVAPAVFTTTAAALRADSDLLEERFGPIALLATYDDDADLLATLAAIPGQLTATLHAQDDDEEQAQAIAELLLARAGRLVYNGVPTGVSVTAAMHHGGPYPSTTAAAHTSVGLAAVQRFLRPVVWQDAPHWLLPAPLRDGNPLGLPRVVDGAP